MPRSRRKQGESGIHHIMLRGINQQQIFQDEEDCFKFLCIVCECKEISKYKLYAYCLMGNHIHLLIQTEKEPLELIFKRIGSRFVYWYNLKYKRTGHLFQDRFKSEPIENDEYFLSALRYIHNNPVKAKMVSDCSQYKFSSYNEYYKQESFVDCEYVLKMISIERFESFHKETDLYSHLEIETNPIVRITDEEAKRIIFNIAGTRTVEEFQRLSQEKQVDYIPRFRENNISIRQICRLTGLTFGIVRKYS